MYQEAFQIGPRRIVRVLEHRGLLLADPERPHLDLEPGSSLDHLQAPSIAYRIAIGPHAGRKALTLYSVPPLEENPWLTRRSGFSLHAATVCEAWQRSRLERLCRYITRPPIATRRLSVESQGWVVYRYKQPFRDGSTHVVLEPLDFIARLAALVPRRPRHIDADQPPAPMNWMQRLRRVFAIDIETSPELRLS